ncbi:histidine phosphatase family protein [Pararhizobium mangrovi]|uniref:Histidine phosphatase family protein n=1 Tax=Pararhizobium mangrovi TaxID=2590452 RepID=A0A506U4I0_9HYPH|nr:histidine phosphatase family protein [Pararhizobium mangrovi]TPW28720.1 histidine phosphatase family protein [Pararhizobium mangrovi]
MLIYFIRHGQTDWNVSEQLQGSHDIPLNDTGRAQAHGNGKHLAEILGDRAATFDYVASPMDRTRETMRIIRGELGLPPEDFRTEERIVELSFGEWEGRTLETVAETEPGPVEAREADKWGFVPPGESAESYAMLAERVEPWLRSVEKDTVCVCHGGIMRAIFFLVGGLPGDEAAHAETPQDRILKYDGTTLDWL